MRKKLPWWKDARTKKFLLLTALIGGATQMGRVWGFLNYVVGTPKAAYAGQAVADKFERYLEKQDAVADALNSYVKQQQQVPNQVAPRPLLREWDDADQTFYCCDSYDRDLCFEGRQWYRCP